jgi:hypothetical protein
MAKDSSMKSTNPRILTINVGSSSIKFALIIIIVIIAGIRILVLGFPRGMVGE